MAGMIHPDDLDFSHSDPISFSLIETLFKQRLSLKPTSIDSPKSTTGQYYKIYFVDLGPGSSRWAGTQVVLRVARKAIPHIKVRNEIGCLKAAKSVGVPVPEVLFFSDDALDVENILGFEFIAMERIAFPALEDHWYTLHSPAFDKVLAQIVDIFVRLWSFPVPGELYGGLVTENDGSITTGPLVEESMWQIPDIARYFNDPSIPPQTFTSLNPTGPFTSYPAYVAAFVKSYIHVISTHPAMSHLAHLVPRLSRLVAMVDSGSAQWVRNLDSVRPRFRHGDLHFGNLLYNPESGEIVSVIDWEFSATGAPFYKYFSPLPSILHAPGPSPDVCPKPPSRDAWLEKFAQLLQDRSPQVYDEFRKEEVLSEEGQHLKDIREYLRSCIEVGVRGWGNLESAKGAWVRKVEAALEALGC